MFDNKSLVQRCLDLRNTIENLGHTCISCGCCGCHNPRDIDPREDVVLVNVFQDGVYMQPEDWIQDTPLPDIEATFSTTVVVIPDQQWDTYPHMEELERKLTAWGLEVRKKSQCPDCTICAFFSCFGDFTVIEPLDDQ